MTQHVTPQQIAHYQQLAQELIKSAQHQGASQVELSFSLHQGLETQVRRFDVETLEYVKNQGMGITVYYGKRKGHASTSDVAPHALAQTLEKACNIAKYTQEDDCAGLADESLMAHDYPVLDIYHPWGIDADTAIAMAIDCEQHAMGIDPRLTNSEGVSVSTNESFSLYGNSHGFIGHYFSSYASINCCLITGQHDNMQRGYDYTVAIDPADLWNVKQLAQSAAKRTLARIGATQINTCQAPVLFSPEVGVGLIKQFIAAISGASQYRRASFLVDSIGQKVFPSFLSMYEDPFIPKGFGSIPFDAEGVKVGPRTLVEHGELQSYLLSSYSARKLGMKTTGNAGGLHNLVLTHSNQSFDDLLKTMDKGLLVTELMGQGINLVTGDYSRGASGFWVEKGRIQYPVEEITIAGNLKDMFQHIVAIGSDVDLRFGVRTGSILIEKMSIAGN